MANALGKYSKTRFKKDIFVNTEHYSPYIRKLGDEAKDISFTIQLPWEQLNSWYQNKQSVLFEYSYVQILNAFQSKRYPTTIQENCPRIEENLRKSCFRAAQKIVRTKGRRREDLLGKVTSFAVQEKELVTAETASVLQNDILRLERANALVTSQNTLLNLKNNETSALVSKMQITIDKAKVDIEKLKQENENLYNVIEHISPQRNFEDKGKSVTEVGKRQQERKLKTLETRVEQALWFSESFGLKLGSVKLVDHLGTPYSLSFAEKGRKSYKDLPTEEQQKIQETLRIMDKFCISDASYHELTCCTGGDELPKSYLIKQCKEDLNKLIYIERTPGEANGAAHNFQDELRVVIEGMVRYLLRPMLRSHITK